jgi:hypothetical protein
MIRSFNTWLDARPKTAIVLGLIAAFVVMAVKRSLV